MKCFFHSNDLDGRCSGALVKLKYPDCEMIGIDYGDDFPWNSIGKNEPVFMVDFSLQPFEQMLLLDSSCNLIWIDHHKTAIEEAKKHHSFHLDRHYIYDGIGACRLVWDFLFFHTNVPLFVKLLSEYDVWDHSDPRTLPFQNGMKVHNTSPENQDFWRSLFDYEQVVHIINVGEYILRYQKITNENYCETCVFEIDFDGLKCIAGNKAFANSQTFDSMWDSKKYDAMLTFIFQRDKWKVSLYSDREDIDVSTLAKKHGGGGHKGAAGFTCENLPFDLRKAKPLS